MDFFCAQPNKLAPPRALNAIKDALPETVMRTDDLVELLGSGEDAHHTSSGDGDRGAPASLVNVTPRVRSKSSGNTSYRRY